MPKREVPLPKPLPYAEEKHAGGSPPVPQVPAEIAAFAGGGACLGSNIDFFSNNTREHARAVAVCHTCDAEADCFAWAMALPEPFGVWGGITATGRRRMREGKVPMPEFA